MNTVAYVFDSNIFINIQRRHPIDIFDSLWHKLGELIDDGIVLSSAEVYDELSVGEDILVAWVKEKKDAFKQSDEKVQRTVRDILSKHENLVLGGKKTNGADPFVIALAKVNSYTVVTEETKNGNSNTPKMPDVCEACGVRYINFVGFLREMDIKF